MCSVESNKLDSSLSESVESFDGTMPFGQFLGSATYMAKNLGTEGVLTSNSDYKSKIKDYIDSLRQSIESETYENTSSQNMANALMLDWVLDQHSEINHWYSRRKFNKDDGSIVYSSLWNGYRIVKYKDVMDGYIVELGSGSARFYKGEKGVWNPMSFEISGEDYDNFWKLVEDDDWEQNSPVVYIKEIMVVNKLIKDISEDVIMFGTQKAREYNCDKLINHGVDVISQEDESRFEYLSVVNAHNEAPQSALQHYELCATVGYGKGSYQGHNTLAFNPTFMHKVGLKRLMFVLGDEEHTKFIKFENTEDFDSAIEDVKDELYNYEEGFMTRIKRTFYKMFN